MVVSPVDNSYRGSYRGFYQCGFCGEHDTGFPKFSVHYRDPKYSERLMRLHVEKYHPDWQTHDGPGYF